MTAKPKAAMLFEISWEVCNKVGGIHTVIRSKLPLVQELYAQYVLIGPLLQEPGPEFVPQDAPGEWQEIFDLLGEQGIRCAYGKWSAPGEPTVILLDGNALKNRRDELLYRYWDRYQVDAMRASWEFEEPMYFSTAAGMLIEEYRRRHDQATVVQAHEWMAGFAILHLKYVSSPVGTVFTTHATILGRTLMGNGHPLYDMLDNLDAKHWAYELNIEDKHLAEVACAHHADAFTTVSEITGIEAESVLGKKPDVLLFNGFTAEKFPTFEETSVMHYQSKEQLQELVASMFFPHYTFDLDKAFFMFTSGRYEFTNKGIDVLVEALGKLNQRLKEERSKVHVVMFFWVIMGRHAVKAEVLQGKNFFSRIKSTVQWQKKKLLQHITLDLLAGREPGEHDATSEFIAQIHKEIPPFKRPGEPPLVTHEIDDEQTDPVLSSCRQQGLLNREDDNVKVILYPGYLDGSDGLLNLSYYDATVGTHLGVFPSHYEPWGYTPMESAMLGVPAVTTDLAGFGRYIKSCDSGTCNGVFIIKREGKSKEEAVEQLAEQLYNFIQMDRQERIQNGFAAKTLAFRCDWKQFIPYYVEAHNVALERADG